MGSFISSTAISAIQIPVLLTTLGLDGIVWPAQTTVTNESTYDYIVVGAGSAGSVVASRLAENTSNSVLLLEAGGDPPLTTFLAALFALDPKSIGDYDFSSSFDPYAAGGQGNYSTFTSGKMLGGSSSINHLLHTRGCPNDLDKWAELTGDKSWSYENMLPYFIKSERVTDEEIMNTYPQYHGTDGPIGLSRQTSDKTTKYLEAFAEVGIPTVLDLNSGTTAVGYTQPLYMIANRIRQSPGRTYLGDGTNSSNLYVSKNTRVVKVIFEGNVAKGVEAIYGGKTYVFKANKEVILSAGVYNTPQILMLSGIGPEDHLNEFGIEVKANLPVGNGFKDQVGTTLVFKTESSLLPILNPFDLSLDLTAIPLPIMVGSVPLNRTQTCADYQTYSFIMPHDVPFLTLICRNVFWYRSDICDSWQLAVTGRTSLYTLLANVAPKSNGTIRLKSIDPFDSVNITTGYFTNEEDLTNQVKYVRDYIKVGSSSYLKGVNAELIGVDLEECADKEYDSDEFWKCYILNRGTSPYHSTSSCAMGLVVDSTLKVIGFERLRVIDASAIAIPPSSAPNALVIALAEKGADLIKNEVY